MVINKYFQVVTVPKDSQIEVDENHVLGAAFYEYVDKMLYIEKYEFQNNGSTLLSDSCSSHNDELNDDFLLNFKTINLVRRNNKPYRTLSLQPFIGEVTSNNKGE